MELDISKWQGLTDWKNDTLGIKHAVIRCSPDTYILTLDVAAAREAGLQVVFYDEDTELQPANS